MGHDGIGYDGMGHDGLGHDGLGATMGWAMMVLAMCGPYVSHMLAMLWHDLLTGYL